MRILLFVFGLFTGFYAFQYAFNLDVLEENSLQQAKISYLAGCSKFGDYSECIKYSELYKKEIEEIYKDTIWNK